MLVAFALRLYRLADANVWWDEGWTRWLSRFDLASIAVRTARDEHPPLHYWLVHFWDSVAGGDASTDAFVGRFFSVFFGVLTVAVVYRLVKRFGGA
ncbi:MAG TPA: glycosyltransferase family 39 protein, partial [Anaerolineae bacterium]